MEQDLFKGKITKYPITSLIIPLQMIDVHILIHPMYHTARDIMRAMTFTGESPPIQRLVHNQYKLLPEMLPTSWNMKILPKA
jgi:hypothetical protein